MNLGAYPARFWLAAGSIVATFVGLFGPWAKAVFVSISGLDTDDGKVIALVAAVAGLMLVIHASQTSSPTPPVWPLVVMLLCGIAIAGASLYDRSDIASRVADSEGFASVGWGIYLDIAAGVLLVIASIGLLSGRNEPYGKRSPTAVAATAPMPPDPPGSVLPTVVPAPPAAGPTVAPDASDGIPQAPAVPTESRANPDSNTT